MQLIWKRIEATYVLRQYETAEKWCRLAMHRLFEKPGEANMAKISRKILLCALGRGDINCARDIFGSMSDAAKEEPLTRFLLYKIAIRNGEVELAAECLEKVASCSEDPTLLFACVLDAQKAGNKTDVLDALWMVLDKCGYGFQENVRLPSIIRMIIVLLVGVIESEGDSRENIEKLCKLFEAGKKFGIFLSQETYTNHRSIECYTKVPQPRNLVGPRTRMVFPKLLQSISKTSLFLGAKPIPQDASLLHWLHRPLSSRYWRRCTRRCYTPENVLQFLCNDNIRFDCES